METPKIREKTMSEAVWKPEVGKTAWAVRGNSVQHVEITKISGDMVWNTSKGWGEVWTVPFGLFPTAEAALASIKVYDLEGNEVLPPPRRSVQEIIDEYKESPEYAARREIENRAFRIMLSDEAGMMNWSFDDCMRMAEKEPNVGKIPTEFTDRYNGGWRKPIGNLLVEKPTDERVESDR